MREFALIAALCIVGLVSLACGGCRKDGAVREVTQADIFGGRYVRFEDSAKVRLLSLSGRDELPSRPEVESFLAGGASRADLLAQWYDGEAHRARVGRVFDDIFGIPGTPFIVEDSHVLNLSREGVYQSQEMAPRPAKAAPLRTQPTWRP